MKTPISLLLSASLCIAVTSCSSSQTKFEQETDQVASFTIYKDSLKKHLYTLASDDYEGRRTGEVGQKHAAKYIVDHYKKLGINYPKGATSYFQYVPSDFMKSGYGPRLKDSENVWGFIEGSDLGEEVLVISAHYDHMGIMNEQTYYGADDNASGTATVLEVARLFKEAIAKGEKPRRSVLFLHVTGEEFGLHGSRYYVENPVLPLENTIANLNIDMVGRRSYEYKGDKDYVFLIGADKLSSDLHNLSEEVNNKTVQLDLDYTFNDVNHPQQIYYRSDHYNFVKHGVPAIFYYNGAHADYHQPTDTPDKIDYDLLQKRAQLIFNTAWKLVNKTERPKIDSKS